MLILLFLVLCFVVDFLELLLLHSVSKNSMYLVCHSVVKYKIRIVYCCYYNKGIVYEERNKHSFLKETCPKKKNCTDALKYYLRISYFTLIVKIRFYLFSEHFLMVLWCLDVILQKELHTTSLIQYNKMLNLNFKLKNFSEKAYNNKTKFLLVYFKFTSNTLFYWKYKYKII